MRLSGLVVAAILFVSATLLAQHSSGAGGSSSGGSHSSSSGGSSSSASSHISSSPVSHVAGTGAAASHLSPSSKLPSTKLPSAKVNAAPEKQGFRSFLRHPFKKSAPVQTAEFKRRPCRKEPCAVCPPGESSNGGACALPSNMCLTGQTWNGFACGGTRYRFNDDCRVLAEQLAEQQRQMRGQDDPGQSLRYQSLRQQYEQCLERSRFHGYSSASLFDAPLIGPRDGH